MWSGGSGIMSSGRREVAVSRYTGLFCELDGYNCVRDGVIRGEREADKGAGLCCDETMLLGW